MSEQVSQRARARALLTDTLPYEVPVIFSNDRLYAALVRDTTKLVPEVNNVVQRIQKLGADVTKPYSYAIVKDGSRFTTLGIIHPTTQTRVAAFYDSFSSALLSSCSYGEYSLRRPFSETPLFSESELNGETTFRIGIPHIDPTDGQLDISHIVSYFSYTKYNLLGKFVESDEFRRLEKRFKNLQMLDISRCFSSIYTHSIAWAVKGKEFSKANKGAFSFESQFDALAQSTNYGETNGIVIGPEISRIFSEVILQDVDRKISASLKPLRNNRDYAIRRYVDDYFIFTNSIDQLDSITSIVAKELEDYKLYFNREKQRNIKRPFVSGISLARAEISEVIGCIYDLVDDIIRTSDPSIVAAKARALRSRATSMRQACSKHNVELHVVSGWLLTNMRNALSKLARHASSCVANLSASLYLSISALLDLIFYVCAVDLRVRTTYALCQCLAVVEPIKACRLPDLSDRVYHFISEEMSVLVRNGLALGSELSMGVEMANLLISGYHYLGASFLRNDAAREALSDMAMSPGVSYFRYITVKFCCHREHDFTSLVKSVNAKALHLLMSDPASTRTDSERYLLFCDLLSSPDLPWKNKAALFRAVFGGNTSKSVLDAAFAFVGFIDWHGTAIEHALRRKALRPVYTWS